MFARPAFARRLSRSAAGLTRRSSGAPTSGRATAPRYSCFRAAGCRRPLNSTLGIAMGAVQYASRVSACRRGLNSHGAAKPRGPGCLQERARTRSQFPRPLPSTGEVGAATNCNYMEPVCHIEPVHCVASPAVQSVRRAAASIGTPGHGQWRRLQHAARPRLQLRAQCVWWPARIAHWHAHSRRTSCAALPNPSLKRSANGRTPGPAAGYGVHFPAAGPGVLPSSPA